MSNFLQIFQVSLLLYSAPSLVPTIFAVARLQSTNLGVRNFNTGTLKSCKRESILQPLFEQYHLKSLCVTSVLGNHNGSIHQTLLGCVLKSISLSDPITTFSFLRKWRGVTINGHLPNLKLFQDLRFTNSPSAFFIRNNDSVHSKVQK